MSEQNSAEDTLEKASIGVEGSNNKSCDVNVSNHATVTIENVVAKYWKANSITGALSGSKITIADRVTLERLQETDAIGITYDTPPNPRNDHWSIEFEYAGESYRYKDKKCNITSGDANKLVTLKVTGTPKKGFTFHVEMPKSSSCSGHMS